MFVQLKFGNFGGKTTNVLKKFIANDRYLYKCLLIICTGMLHHWKLIQYWTIQQRQKYFPSLRRFPKKFGKQYVAQRHPSSSVSSLSDNCSATIEDVPPKDEISDTASEEDFLSIDMYKHLHLFIQAHPNDVIMVDEFPILPITGKECKYLQLICLYFR